MIQFWSSCTLSFDVAGQWEKVWRSYVYWAVLAKNTPFCNIICSLTESTISAQFGLMNIPKCPIFYAHGQLMK